MSSVKALAILLTFLILTPGCLSLFGDDVPSSESVNCELEPNDPACDIVEKLRMTVFLTKFLQANIVD